MYVKMNHKGELLPAKGEDEGARLITDEEEEALNLTRTVVNNIKDKYFPGWNTKRTGEVFRSELPAPQSVSPGVPRYLISPPRTTGITHGIPPTAAQVAALWEGKSDWLDAVSLATEPKTIGAANRC